MSLTSFTQALAAILSGDALNGIFNLHSSIATVVGCKNIAL